MTAKPINPSFAEFSGDDPILRGSRIQYRQKLLRKSPKARVSSELTPPEINIIPVFHGEWTAGSPIGGNNRGGGGNPAAAFVITKAAAGSIRSLQTAGFSRDDAASDRRSEREYSVRVIL